VTLNGLVFLRTKAVNVSNPAIPTSTDYKMFADHSAYIPYGTWDMFFVGFSGPNNFEGTKYCGSLLNSNLNAPNQSFNVDLLQSNCTVEPYLTIISDIQTSSNGIWGTANWDQKTWGP